MDLNRCSKQKRIRVFRVDPRPIKEGLISYNQSTKKELICLKNFVLSLSCWR